LHAAVSAPLEDTRDSLRLQNFRRLVVHYERYAENFGMLYVGCCSILLRQYEMACSLMASADAQILSQTDCPRLQLPLVLFAESET
jgi:hypothetical protein